MLVSEILTKDTIQRFSKRNDWSAFARRPGKLACDRRPSGSPRPSSSETPNATESNPTNTTGSGAPKTIPTFKDRREKCKSSPKTPLHSPSVLNYNRSPATIALQRKETGHFWTGTSLRCENRVIPGFGWR